MANQKSTKTSKKDKKYAGWSYIVSRMEYLMSIGIWRCIEEKGCEKCCEKCRDYYK